jgi:hypothetical protein
LTEKFKRDTKSAKKKPGAEKNRAGLKTTNGEDLENETTHNDYSGPQGSGGHAE